MDVENHKELFDADYNPDRRDQPICSGLAGKAKEKDNSTEV
jgi:hypothetical protein